MIVNYLLLFLSWTSFTSAVRTRRADDEGATLIICDGGDFTATCPYGTSVNITSAEFGRTSKENNCAKTGFPGKDICRSRKALYRAYSFCAAKTRCTMKVDSETLETPVKEDGTGCYDTSIYLRLVYTCVRDCQAPIFNYNSEVVGGEYHVTSTVNLKCRKGYEQVDGQAFGITKTCMDDQTWVGPTLLCRDTNECANPSTNRCHKFALCQNTRGSYSCTCSNGYHGDGVTCTADTWFKSDDWSDADSNETGTTIDDEWDQALIAVHDEKVCGKRITKGRQGILKSPRSPLNYPSDTTCIWILAVPPGFVVELRFMKFDLEREERNEGCSHDNVTLYDGLNRDPKWWLGTFCGDEIPDTILSQTNKVRIEFRSDQTAQFSGFEIRFSAINLNFACLNFPAPSYTGIIIMNGTRNSTTQPRKSLELGCDVGFTVTSSRLVRTCQDDGKWDDFSNPCSPVSCGYPIIPLNEKGLVVKADQQQFRYGQRPVRYECEIEYRMVIQQGYDDVIVCDRQGRWSNEVHGIVPSCEEITCVCQTDVTCAANHGDPAPHNALQWKVVDHEGKLVQQPVGRTFFYGSRIEYSCREGYVISGDDVRLCVDDGWSGKRTACEEVPIAGLTTFHIAIIASVASVFVILVVTIVLIIFCCRDHKRKKCKRKLNQQRRLTAGRDNEGFIMNLALAGNEDFLYGNTVERRGRKRGFSGRHNNIRQYQPRPHVLPISGVTHDHSRVEATTPSHQPRPQSGIPRSPQFNVEIRPNRTFRPNQHHQPSPQQPNRNRATSSSRDNPRASSLTKISSPPPGYQDPPPSYETMVREGNKKFDKKRNNKRII